MAEQILYQGTSTEAKRGDSVFIRQITQVVRVSDERIVLLLAPFGENNIRVVDNDRWDVRVEGFPLDADHPTFWAINGVPVEATRGALRLDPKGFFETGGVAQDLLAIGIPAPNPAGTDLISFSYGGYSSTPWLTDKSGKQKA